MKFFALSALTIFGLLIKDSSAALINNDPFGNLGFNNGVQTNIGGSNTFVSNLPNPFNFGQLSDTPNNLVFPSFPQANLPLGTSNQNQLNQNQLNPNQNIFSPFNQNQFNQNQNTLNQSQIQSTYTQNNNQNPFYQNQRNNNLIINQVNSDILSLKSINRTFDGTGNNLRNPKWGSKDSELLRLCNPNYQDGKSIMWPNMPNPREVSNLVGQIEGPVKQNTFGVNMLFTIWGQFLDHDLTLSKTTQGAQSQSMNIKIPKCDNYLDKKCTGKQEMPVTRSISTKSSIRTNTNVLTAWLDASMVYGSDKTTADSLREFRNGKMRMRQGNLLPKNAKGQHMAGDSRADENAALNTFHTIFVRQHNRLCDLILKRDSRLSDEEIFQIARNYVIGLVQHITFDQYLPELIGRRNIDQLIGAYRYDETANPSIFTEFSSAAFRIGHPLINSPFKKIDNNGRVIESIQLADMFFNPSLMTNDSVTQFLNGMIKTSAKQRSMELIDDIRNFLFLLPNSEVKIDLFSFNLQRGRDHGICSIKEARSRLGLPAKSIRELFENQQKAKIIERLYFDSGNIDLWLGIIGENRSPDAIMGELGIRLNAFQFQKIRNGDRFWYEKAYPQSIVRQIKETSFGDVIKRNTGVTTVNLNTFKKV